MDFTAIGGTPMQRRNCMSTWNTRLMSANQRYRVVLALLVHSTGLNAVSAAQRHSAF